MSYLAVTFDLDDTLVVLERDRETILQEAAAAAGAPPFSREAYLTAHADEHNGPTRTPIFERLLDDAGVADVDASELALEYRERIGDALAPVPGVEEMLAELREHTRVGLITNGPVVAQQDKLERLGWTECFDAIVISGAVGKAKPDEHPFTVACDRLETDPHEMVHVGDHPVHDIQGALSAGMDAIYVGRPETISVAVPVVAHSDIARTMLTLVNPMASV